ncbi:helix-turn-helix domain-containing protein [Streptomyces noursei]|uniref:helix-turn-helix domain-containing protein n=1 Tax=Streptomyces noursei TaxID=1971 RepID=UPI000A73DFDE
MGGVTSFDGAARISPSSGSAIEFRRVGDGVPVAAHERAVLDVSSGALGWRGIAVEGGRMPGWEVTDLVVEQHMVALNLDAEPLVFERVVGGRPRIVTMPPGSVWVNPAGHPITHRIRAHSHYLNLTLDDQRLALLTGRDDLVLRGAVGESSPQLAALMTAVSAEARQGGRHGTTLLDTLALAVASLLHQDFSVRPAVREPSGALSARQVSAATELMRSRLAEGVSVVELAASAGYSPDHFTRCFRRATGDTPHRYLTRLRVEEARCLLLGTARTVADIAAATGFADHAHLTRTLRRALNVTPSELRRS